MQFQLLKLKLEEWETNEKTTTHGICTTGMVLGQIKPVPALAKVGAPPSNRGRELVAGGDVLWKPVDRMAAKLIMKAPWWAHAPVEIKQPVQPTKPKKDKKKMNRNISTTQDSARREKGIPDSNHYISESGLPVTMINGEAHCRVEDMQAMITSEVLRLVPQTNPAVKAAEDARKVLDELCAGMGRDMETFKTNTKLYLEDIRQTRFAVVTETAAMTHGLKDIRQFFIGSDYKEQVARLGEFVGLCERLHELKKSGFLDSVADTMLRLADKPA